MRASTLAAALAVAAPLAALATDAPHDASWAGAGGAIDCSSCHRLHFSPGGTLTAQAGNFNLCQSCHLNSTNFGFPWAAGHQATPGTGGRSHRWDAVASNLGATPPNPASADPLESGMGKHLDTGNVLKCSTCHDVHQADAFPGTAHTSVPLATNVSRTAGTGTGSLQLTSVPSGAKAFGYVLRISGASQFKISHDNGATYFGWNGTSWGADSLGGFASGKPFTPGAAVSLDDGVTTVTFGATGTFSVGDTFASFYVSYPFLRGNGGAMCVGCHKDRNQTWQNVEGTGPLAGNGQAITLGTTVFSHPVGQAPNANARGYDRASGAILDADGGVQSPGDGNPTNDLVLVGGTVGCLTCHHPHNADSNSLTVDPR
jgi:predicted CXXCH cytochrome family protein